MIPEKHPSAKHVNKKSTMLINLHWKEKGIINPK
jgi:hypothetical protein